MNDQPDQQAETHGEAQTPEIPEFTPFLLEKMHKCSHLLPAPGDAVVRQLIEGVRIAQRERDDLRAQLTTAHQEATAFRTSWHNAQAEAGRLREALEALLEPQTEECRLDHHGYCQAHYLESANSCCVAKARAALAKEGGE